MTLPQRPVRTTGPLDLPAPFHAKARQALDEFDALMAEYALVLDTQRALLASESVDAVAESLARGDALARQAGHCAKRLAPVREALLDSRYSGARVTELRRRIEQASSSAAVLSARAAQLASSCASLREIANDELAADNVKQRAAARGHAAYAPRPQALTLDITR